MSCDPAVSFRFDLFNLSDPTRPSPAHPPTVSGVRCIDFQPIALVGTIAPTAPDLDLLRMVFASSSETRDMALESCKRSTNRSWSPKFVDDQDFESCTLGAIQYRP